MIQSICGAEGFFKAFIKKVKLKKRGGGQNLREMETVKSDLRNLMVPGSLMKHLVTGLLMFPVSDPSVTLRKQCLSQTIAKVS